jgi:hypothetical protein
MRGTGKEIISIFFVAIVLYLLLNNGSNTTAIINAGGSAISNAAAVLQGRGGSTGFGSSPLAQPGTLGQ